MGVSRLHETEGRIGEVVEASTTTFVTQCYNLYNSPSIGSIVRANNRHPVYGIVSNINTQAIDPSRKPVPRGIDVNTEEDVYNANPQLQHLLRTEFQSTIVAYQAVNNIRFELPPTPPQIYSFVQTCPPEEFEFPEVSTYLIKSLVNANLTATDEVIAACLKSLATVRDNPTEFLINSGKDLIYFFQGDFRRVEQIIKSASNE